jgi:transcriptional regulator with XRE-family HTH domain
MIYKGTIRDAAMLGRMLAQARGLKGWSQRELASKLGLSQRYIWEMEAGEPNLFVRRLFDYMRATGMTLTAQIDPGQPPTPGGDPT